MTPGLADGSSDFLISFKTGAIAEMVATTLHLARRYLVFAVLVGFIVEWAGKSPSAPRDYAGCAWRSFIVLFLLVFYTDVFGSVVNLSNAITRQVTPPSVVERLYGDFKSQLKSSYGSVRTAQQRALQASTPEEIENTGAEAQKASLDFIGKIAGGVLLDTLVGLFAAIGLVVHWLVSRVAILLMTLFYVLGPLALVFSIPSVSQTGTKWFSEFVAFCSWPIISGLLLRISVALGSHLIFGTGPGAMATLASALLMTATAIATPALANRLVGGGVNSAASQGLETARQFASSGIQLAKRGIELAKNHGREEGDAAGRADAPRNPRGRGSSGPPSNRPGE